MKIRSLRVEQFRRFDRPVAVDGFADGLNLIAGPNETGKSTLFLAIRAALFERHGTKSDAVKNFAPHHVTGGRPTITLDVEIDGDAFRLEKSFLKRPSAVLQTSEGRRFEGTEADSELKRRLGLDPSEKTSINKGSPAHFGVLLTPQTQSFRQPHLADDTRHNLEAAIAREIADLGNQSEVDRLLADVDEMLFDVVSKRGEPKNRFKDVTTRLNEVEGEIREANQERDALEDQLEQLQQAIDERRDLQQANNRENLADRLTLLEAARAKAAHHQTLENRRLAANQHLQALETKRAARQARLDEKQRLTAELDTIEKAAKAAGGQLATIEETLKERDEALADLRDQEEATRQRYGHLDALSRHYERLRQIKTTLSALATDVRLSLDASALDRVTLDGEAAEATEDLRQVTEGLSIEIVGVGSISIQPKTEPMREALAAETEIEQEIEKLLATLDLEDQEPEAIEVAWQAVVSERDNLAASRTDVETTLADMRREAAETKAALDASNEQKDRLTRRLAEIDAAGTGTSAEDQALFESEIAEARAALEMAEQALAAEGQHQGEDAQAIDTEIADLRTRIDARRRAAEEIGKKVVALESAITVRSGLGLDDRIDQLERQRHLLTQERDAFALDHQALSLLQKTLREAADEARTTFNAPLSARLAPYIQDLFPGATPVVTPDFSIRAIDRNGVEEPFLHLSDGTREQIAILARLAYADMLREQGLPAMIVLDDALAFSDDRRFQRMIGILKKAAERMQIIILTCREERFAEIEATRLKIEPAPEAASSAA